MYNLIITPKVLSFTRRESRDGGRQRFLEVLKPNSHVEQETLSCSKDKTTSLFRFYLFVCKLVVPPWTRNLLVPKSSFSCLVLLTNARKDKDFSALCELLIPLYLIDSFETNHEKGQEKSGQDNENILICLSTFSHPLHCFIFSFL